MMTLPKELTTLTSLSKYVTAVLFLTLPILAFFLGMQYQSQLEWSIGYSPPNDVPTLNETVDLQPSISTRLPQGLVTSLEVPFEVQDDMPIHLKIRLKNTHNSPAELILGGRPAHDFIITNEDGVEVWRWTQNGAIQLINTYKTLNVGEELEFVAEWPQVSNTGEPITAGSYRVQGVLNLQEQLETEPKELNITSRL